MEHVLVEVAPGRQRTMLAAAAVQPDSGRGARRSRRSWQPSGTGWRPIRHRQDAARQRADLRQFESALARWTI
jgi:hypothetical protein